MRVNPRNRSVKSIYKTHIDVLHVEVEHNIESLSDLVASKRAACPDDEDEHLDASNSAAETFRREMIQIGCTENIYQQLADSIAPSIFGMEDTKKGILCQLFGGVRKVPTSAVLGCGPGFIHWCTSYV